MYVEELMRFGLSEKEAKVYLSLLELEVATVNEIAKTAEINRSSAYVVLESLRKRGLASVSAGKKITKYVVSPPDQLARLAERTTKEQVSIKEEIDQILPDLKSLYKGVKEKPRVDILEGKEGLIAAFESTLKVKEPVMRVVSSTDDIQKTLPEYLPTYVEKRMKLGIKMYGIHPFTPGADYLRKNIAHIDDVQLIPPEKWNFRSDFAIFDNTLAFMLHKELLAIRIDNEAVADGMKKIFDLAFEEARRLNTEGSDFKKAKSGPQQ